MSDNTGLMEDRPFEPHVPEFKDQNGVLRFTQNLRLQVIQTKTRNGAAIGAMSDEDTELVLKAANDIDRQAMTAMKLQSDNDNADADRCPGRLDAAGRCRAAVAAYDNAERCGQERCEVGCYPCTGRRHGSR